MIGKRADHGHVDLFPPFNHGLKDNLNLKYNWQTGIPNVSIWEERELFLKKWLANGYNTGGQIFSDLFIVGRSRAGRFNPTIKSRTKRNLNLKNNWQTGRFIPTVESQEERELYFKNDWQRGNAVGKINSDNLIAGRWLFQWLAKVKRADHGQRLLK